MTLLHNVRRVFGFLWRMLDGSRRILFNLLFLALIILVLFGLFSEGRKLDDKTVLVLDLRGNVVEQESAGARRLLMLEAQGEKKYYAQLRDVIEVLDAAAKDPKIISTLLLLDEMQDAGLPMLREIAVALENFKASDKKVIAWGTKFNQKQYLLAAHADEIYVHPMGVVILEGLGGYKSYYRDALDKLGITVNVMRVGSFKSAVEPFIANGPSSEASAAEAFLYNDLWATYLHDVERARKLEPGSIMHTINDLPNQMKQANGDWAKLALSTKLVDGLKTRDELRQLMLQYGAENEDTNSFRQVNYEDYLAHHNLKLNLTSDAVAVVIAEGEISDGIEPAGSIGGLSTANLIRKAREDDQIKAVVLRINSPGGSALGSELIRRELELTRQEGKPVVISMGNVAASGGYWMSMSADEIFADATTITGSIGVFTLLPTADKALKKIGVHSEGTTTAWLRGAYYPARPMDPRFVDVMQQSVNHTYTEFINVVATDRNTTTEKIEAVAQGRVWSGQQAKERGLVDTLGGFTDAIKSAATRAGLTEDYVVNYIEIEPTGLEKFLKLMDISIAKMMTQQFYANVFPSGVLAAAPEMPRDMRWLTEMTNRGNGFGVVTHCMCYAP